MKKNLWRSGVMVVLGLFLGACVSSPTPTVVISSTPISISAASDLLAEIIQRGTMRISLTHLDEPGTGAVKSALKPGGQRPATTLCAQSELTSAELQGFNVDVAEELSARLGVEVCFVLASPEAVRQGKWERQWDVSVSSLEISPQTQKALYFTTPYYYDQGRELGVALDRNDALSPIALLINLDAAVQGMHTDGTLSRLSQKWFGADLTHR